MSKATPIAVAAPSMRATAKQAFKRKAATATVLAALAQYQGAAFAADPPPREATLPQVTVTGTEEADGPVQGYRATRSSTFTKTDTPLKEVPASVSVVPAQVIKDQAMGSMSDVFRYVPGAVWHQGEGNRDQVVLRGTSTTADFYLNGIRDDAQVFRDLYNIERVEVLKGPGGMIFGRGGAGGVVNRVTKQPVFGRIGETSVTLGSNSQLRGTLDYGDKIGDSIAFRINGMAESADSFRNGVTSARYAVNPAMTFALGSRTFLTLDYESLRDQRTPDRGNPSFNNAPYNNSSSIFFGNAQQSNSHSYVESMGASLQHEFSADTRIKNSLRITEYDKYYQNVYPGSAVSAAGTMTLAAYNNRNDRTNIFNQTDLTTKLRTGGIEHTLLTGLEVGTQASRSVRNSGFFGASLAPVVSAQNPFATVTSFRPNTTDADNYVKSDVAAVYVQDQMAFSKEWKVLAGLRYDRFTVSFDDRRTLVPQTDLSRTDSAFSPRAGLIYTPTDRQTYYVSYSFAFLPSGEQLSLASGTVDLSPEKAKNYEVGARWDVAQNLTLSSAIFRTDRDDVKVTDPANPTLFVKTGKQRTSGVEVGLQGDVTRDWQVYAGYSYMDGKVVNALTTGTAPGATVPAGRVLPLVPKNMLSVWNKVSFSGGWSAGLGVIYQAESYATIGNTVKIPSFWRADTGVYYTFADKKTRLALNIENLFNKVYYPTVDGDNNITVGAPRNARLTFSTPF